MSIKLQKWRSKKKKFPKHSAQTELMISLGLGACSTSPLDPTSMLEISTWAREGFYPAKLSDLPNDFLHRLWLLRPDARSPSISPPSVYVENHSKSSKVIMNAAEGDQECAVNPLDLVTAVFISSNTFFQQEIVSRMLRCHFAVPLVLPTFYPQENGCFLLWPLRGALSQWRIDSADPNVSVIHEGDLVHTPMPIVSCVRLGHCTISKSQILNCFMQSDAFLHKGSSGGRPPRRLSDGMVEIAQYLPRGDDTDAFPVPVLLANLRGDACAHENNLSLLCQASSVVVIFCENQQGNENKFVDFCKNTANRVIIVDMSDSAGTEISFEQLLHAQNLSIEDLADRLCGKLNFVTADHSTHVTLLAAAQVASKIGLNVDEGPVCRKAEALAEQVLEGLDKGSALYLKKQLPLQGQLWRKLSEIEKGEKKHQNTDLDSENTKKTILEQLSSYTMTPAMKMFTDALFTNDITERTYFINWMKLKLTQIQSTNRYEPEDVCDKLQSINGKPVQATEAENGISDEEDSFCTEPSFEEETLDETFKSSPSERQNLQCHATGNHDGQALTKLDLKPLVLGLQHFLREMGLMYQLTHMTPSNSVQRFPSLAAELLLYGIPLEIMDGDASNIPVQWIGCVLAELRRRLPQEHLRTRVLTTLGPHKTRNPEVLSTIFNMRFYEDRNRCTRGIYLLGLCVPANLQNDFKCDILLLLDVEGLCSGNDTHFLVHDNEMATVATGLSDVLIENVASDSSSKFDNIFTVLVNALLRVKDFAPMPVCQIVSHDDDINTILLSRQLNRVLENLQRNGIPYISKPTTCQISDPVSLQYGNAVMDLKKNLFKAMKENSHISEAISLPLFIGRLCSVWDAVRESAFSVSLQNTNVALSFSMLCTEISQWESALEEHMDKWFMEAIKKIFASTTQTSTSDILNELMDEAHSKVMTEVDAVISHFEDYWVKDQHLNMYSETLKPEVIYNIEGLREKVTQLTKQRLMKVSGKHCCSLKIQTFETRLRKKQEIKLCELTDYSRSTNTLQEDKQLEEEFERVWLRTVTNSDLRPSETEDITPRVIGVLQQNFNSRGLHKHRKNIDKIGQTQPEGFQICVEHTAQQSPLKQMFKDHRINLRSQAQQVAACIIERYNTFFAEKSRLKLHFSDSYITELLEIIEKTLSEKKIEAWSLFEADLKVYLCSVACNDFQKMHDTYNKDKFLLESINVTKTASLAEFMYQFRKREQGQRLAQTFTLEVIRPVLMDYVYTPLGKKVLAEIQKEHPEFQSPLAFYQILLEELLNDGYENLVDFLLSYDTFRRKKIQDRVLVHLSESNLINNWRLQRLEEITGKIASVLSQTGEDLKGRLSPIKFLLEDVCLALEADIDIDISRAALEGPVFDISTDWTRFVTSLLEELAAIRSQLCQEFSEPVEGQDILLKLPIQPQDFFIERLKGCQMCCPSCGAPCELEDREHEIHKFSLHRPKPLFPPGLSVGAFLSPVNGDDPLPDPMSICCEALSADPALYWK
ncbi:unnamed protein product [Knipowitschia caucasica]